MNFLFSSSSLRVRRAAALATLPLALLFGLSGCQSTPSDAAALAALAPAPEIPGLATYSYEQSFAPLKALDAAVAAAGKNPTTAAALVARLTIDLQAPTTTFAARQAICERLGHLLIAPGGGEISARHPTLAVLAPWLQDAKLAPLALLALERVPSPAVDEVLRTAVARASGPTKLAIESCLQRRQAGALPALPAPGAVGALVADLGGADLAKQEWAWQQLARLPADEVAKALAPKLGAWEAEKQRAALVLLGRQGHAAAVPVALSATQHADVGVRVAAIQALGRLPGNTAVAQRLLELGVGTSVEETKAALAALARLAGPGIGEQLLAGAKAGAQPATRVFCLRALAARYALEAVPLAYQLRQDGDATIRAAALDLLGDIAPIGEQGAVLAWTFALTDDQEVARAQRALVAITQRAPKPADAIAVVLAALEKAEPAVQARQVRMLPRLGDTASQACAQRLAASADAKVAAAAKAALDRWPKPEDKKK